MKQDNEDALYIVPFRAREITYQNQIHTEQLSDKCQRINSAIEMSNFAIEFYVDDYFCDEPPDLTTGGGTDAR